MGKFIDFYNKQKLIIESLEDYKNKMENTFGEIFTENKNFDIDENNVYNLFNILNSTVFKNKLPYIEIDIVDFNESEMESKYGKIFAGRHVISFDLNAKTIRDNDGFEHYPWTTKIEIVKIPDITLNDYVDILCHEMIHYYDFLFDLGKYGFESNIIKLYGGEQLNEDDYNPHGEVFIKYMNRINSEYGFNIKVNFIMNENENKIETLLIEDENNDKAINFAKKLRKLVKDDGYSFVNVKDGVVTISII